MPVVALRPFSPDDACWIIARHQQLHAQADGFEDSFGVLVRDIVSDFVARHDPAQEAGWIAMEGQQRVGSIFCDRLSDHVAKLRLFQLSPRMRGKGPGRKMLLT